MSNVNDEHELMTEPVTRRRSGCELTPSPDQLVQAALDGVEALRRELAATIDMMMTISRKRVMRLTAIERRLAALETMVLRRRGSDGGGTGLRGESVGAD